MKEKRGTVELALPLLIAEDREKKFGTVMKLFNQRQRRLNDDKRVGELRIQMQYERKFIGKRERSWDPGHFADDLEENELAVTHRPYHPFIIL